MLAWPAWQASAHLQQFDVEDQRGVRRDYARGAAGAVTEGGGDGERAAAAHLHGRDPLIPALDHLALADGEGEGFVAVARAIELLAVLERARVVHRAHLARLGAGARSDDDIDIGQ